MTAIPGSHATTKPPRLTAWRFLLRCPVYMVTFVALMWLWGTCIDHDPFDLARALKTGAISMTFTEIFLFIMRRRNRR